MIMDVQRQNPWLSATMTRMDLAAIQAFFDYRITIAMAITFTFYYDLNDNNYLLKLTSTKYF